MSAPQPQFDRPVALEAAVSLFDRGSYLAAHECLEELWEATEGADSDFYRGLIQAAIALHHFQNGNLAGAAKLYSGHRRFLARYLPIHRGIDVARFLAEMRVFLAPVVARSHSPGTSLPFPESGWPRLGTTLG